MDLLRFRMWSRLPSLSADTDPLFPPTLNMQAQKASDSPRRKREGTEAALSDRLRYLRPQVGTASPPKRSPSLRFTAQHTTWAHRAANPTEATGLNLLPVPGPFMLRDFPHCIHHLFRLKICVAAQRILRHWRQPGGRSDTTANGQEQNRRVIVRGLLQNEGIAGIQECTGSHRMSPGVQAREGLHRDRNRYGNSSSRSRLHLSLLFAPACTGKKRLDRDEKWGSFHG